MTSAPADAELVRRARVEGAAFGPLYERYVDRIYSYHFYRTGSAAEAEDLTARTFFQALSHLADFEERGLPFAAWLFTIAHNLVANYHRDRSRHPITTLETAERNVAPTPFATTDDARVVQEAVSHLSPERQHLVLLKYAEGMTNAEIGQVLNKSEGAVKSLLRRTLDALRRDLERGEHGEVGRPEPGNPTPPLGRSRS